MYSSVCVCVCVCCKLCFLHFLLTRAVTGSLRSFPACRCLHRPKVTFVTSICPLTVAAVTLQSLHAAPTHKTLPFTHFHISHLSCCYQHDIHGWVGLERTHSTLPDKCFVLHVCSLADFVFPEVLHSLEILSKLMITVNLQLNTAK